MNTLTFRLPELISNHLTVVEDVLINDQDHHKPKNVKVAVRSGDWKGALYFLQRYQYQKFILAQAYYGACQANDIKLMKLFKNSTAIDMEKYRVYRSQYTEKILTKKCEIKDISSELLADIFYKIGKHDRGLDLFNLLDDKAHIPDDYYVGRIKYILNIDRKHLMWAFEWRYTRREVILATYELVVKYQNVNDISVAMLEYCRAKSSESKVDISMIFIISSCWVALLIFMGQYKMADRIIKLLETLSYCFNCSHMPTIEKVLLACVRIDNLDVFLQYFDTNYVKTVIPTAYECDAIKILQYIFNNCKPTVDDFKSSRTKSMSDPRVAKMLVDYSINNNIEIKNIIFLCDNAEARGFDIVVKILSRLLWQRY